MVVLHHAVCLGDSMILLALAEKLELFGKELGLGQVYGQTCPLQKAKHFLQVFSVLLLGPWTNQNIVQINEKKNPNRQKFDPSTFEKWHPHFLNQRAWN